MTVVDRFDHVYRTIQEKSLACGREPQEVSLVVVTKTHSVNSISSLYQRGIRDFGESRLQEVVEKIPCLPIDCRWHFIGKLQGNKVAKAIPLFHLIHSVDSLKLAKQISEVSQDKGVTTSILLQVNTSGEKSKQGLPPDEWESVLDEMNALTHLKIEGLMTMAPLVEDKECIRQCFRSLSELRDKWKQRMRDPSVFYHLSMGMSHDYLIAIEEGATIVRIGSAIFGSG